MSNHSHSRTWVQQIKHYFTSHAHAGSNGLEQLGRSPLTSFMTCLVIGIALALPSALFVFLKNAETISHSMEQSAQLTLYLKKDISEARVHNVVQGLLKNPAIASAHAISPQQGLQELQEQADLKACSKNCLTIPYPGPSL